MAKGCKHIRKCPNASYDSPVCRENRAESYYAGGTPAGCYIRMEALKARREPGFLQFILDSAEPVAHC